jgi:hypothetical protein
MRTAAAATAISTAPSTNRGGLFSTGAIGKKSTSTTRQIHGATYLECRRRARAAAPAAATPNSTPRMIPYCRIAPGSLSAD